MDPAVPWSAYAAAASYNRLANATGSFQTASPEFQNTALAGHQTGGQAHTTANQLLLQAAAHTSATLAGQLGQTTTFNPGGFLSPPPVGYDTVFSPLFHHNTKPAHYSTTINVTQQRPALANTVPAKQTTVESEVQNLRENYAQVHHPGLGSSNTTSYFEHQTSGGTTAWSHQSNNQLPSPFGILPHESVVVTSPGPTKQTHSFENTFSTTHFTTQTINPLNSQLVTTNAEYSKTAGNSNHSSSSYANDTKKSNRSQSPLVTVNKPVVSPATTVSSGSTFFQNQSTPTTFADSGAYQKTYTNSNSVPQLTNSQTCIVSTPTTAGQIKAEYRILQSTPRTSTTYLTQSARPSSQNTAEKTGPNRGSAAQNFVSPPTKTASSQHSVQTKAQSKVYPELSSQSNERRPNTETSLESNQSSPISFALSYPTNKNVQRSGNSQYVVGQTYRYNEGEFHNRKTGSADSAYSSGSNNGPECSAAVPRRPSPLQSHSQASPLGHVPSPAYPMYNSPMANMSSPSNVECQTNNFKNSQVTPASPLDVSVTRTPNSQQNVAYPSVITRTENAGTVTNSPRNHGSQIWEGDASQRQNRTPKFPNSGTSNYNGIEPSQVNVTPQRLNPSAGTVLSVGERQQGYFDATTHTVTLQDLSSCRGDPVAVVKNLQNSSATQTTTTEGQIKAEESQRTAATKATNQKTRRKANEKSGNVPNELAGATMTEYLTNRVPPPAHHNTQNQQQQNGAYFEFERWNIPPATTKIFTGTAGPFASHGTNFVGSSAHQHQGLMVPHPPPPIPYFPAFHISTGHHSHHPQEFHPSVEITTIPFSENSQAPNQTFQQQSQPKDDNPKVIVPDIEKELEYLSQTAHAQAVLASQQNPNISQQLPPPIRMPAKKHNDPNSGFMASYLKFLQGERDSSPPPPNRGGRKTTWTRTKLYAPELKSTALTSTPVAKATLTTPGVQSSVTTTMVTTPIVRVNAVTDSIKKGNQKPYNPDDDPRFYPLPKGTIKRKLNDSDSSDEDSKMNRTYPQMSNLLDSGRSANKKSGKVGKSSAPTSAKKKAESGNMSACDPLFLPPRRETSKRRAKEKTSMKNLLDKQNQDEEQDADDPDFVDSDSDPVWVPGAKCDSDDEGKGRKKKSRSLVSKSLNTSLVKRKQEDSSSEDDIRVSKKNYSYSRTGQNVSRSKNVHRPIHSEVDTRNISTNVSEPHLVIQTTAGEPQDSMDLQVNKTGEFVVMKSDLHEEYPPIWRIDGKTLLQKYEPFDENGKTLYRNISTYSGWTAQNRHIYVTVPVRFRVQSRMETIVELMRDEMNTEDPELMERVMKDLEKYQDSFEVYIQTLISQALDSNFLTEILQEQDEYFLNNVRAIDEVTEDHCRRLLNVTKWKSNLVISVRTWPCLNVIHDLPKEHTNNTLCSACEKPKVSMRIQMYGQPYNSTTLEGCQPDPKALTDKDFLLCHSCGWKVSLCSKAAHQKYLMYIECAKRVTEKRASDPNKDTTCILNELLADETWLNQLFLDVRTSWAEIEKIEHLSCESNKHLLQNAVASAGIS
ncbi:hypothetical protein RUM43_015012 [Polyplax serrata]|uniref:DUF4211 domain-containing protein n=1 Tax=Polyplax serrata TaxID=468196 RepID=A0AAN8PPZ1_POLSC